MTIKWMHYINDEAQSSNAATWRLSLPNRGNLHSMLLKCACTNGATGGRAVSILDVIDKVEIIADGSEVIYSLEPTEIEKWYETIVGKALQGKQSEAANAVQHVTFPIMFGRWLYDPEYFLPLEKFKDVKLEITFSPSIAADGGFATGTTTFDLMLLTSFSEPGVSYKATLKHRQIKAFTSVASGDEEVELPDDIDIRNIGIYAYETAVADGTDITKVVLEDKASGEKLYDADWPNLIDISRELHGADIVHNIELFALDNDTIATRLGEIQGWSVHGTIPDVDATDIFYLTKFDAIAGDRLTLCYMKGTIVAAGESLATQAIDGQIFVQVWGKSPSYFGVIPYDYADVPGSYLDTAKYGKPTVILTQGGADAAVKVSVQEVKVY